MKVYISMRLLIWTIERCFENIGKSKRKTNTKEWKKLTDAEYLNYENTASHATCEIADLCDILVFDVHRLYTIVRMVQRWEKELTPSQQNRHEKASKNGLKRSDSSSFVITLRL